MPEQDQNSSKYQEKLISAACNLHIEAKQETLRDFVKKNGNSLFHKEIEADRKCSLLNFILSSSSVAESLQFILELLQQQTKLPWEQLSVLGRSPLDEIIGMYPKHKEVVQAIIIQALENEKSLPWTAGCEIYTPIQRLALIDVDFLLRLSEEYQLDFQLLNTNTDPKDGLFLDRVVNLYQNKKCRWWVVMRLAEYGGLLCSRNACDALQKEREDLHKRLAPLRERERELYSSLAFLLEHTEEESVKVAAT